MKKLLFSLLMMIGVQASFMQRMAVNLKLK